LFEKKYGIKMKHWRGDATEIVNRAVTEARAGRPTFDVTLGNEAVMAGKCAQAAKTFNHSSANIIERKLL
jgi:ABC-type Fe3+ transport system substrate-binding protein